jgi:TonB family protein
VLAREVDGEELRLAREAWERRMGRPLLLKPEHVDWRTAVLEEIESAARRILRQGTLREEWRGEVWVGFEVDPRGEPVRFWIERSSGYIHLDAAAEGSVKGGAPFVPCPDGAPDFWREFRIKFVY